MGKFPRILAMITVLGSSVLSGCSFILATESSAPYTVDNVIEMTAFVKSSSPGGR